MPSKNTSFLTRAATKLRGTAATTAVAFTALACVAANAQAQADVSVSAYGQSAPTNFDQWIARNFVVVAGNNPDALLYQTPKGGVYDGIAALFVSRSDGNFLCTGALLAGTNNVLTAAHCLADGTGTNITNGVLAVFFPAGQPASVREIIASSSTHVNPLYTGEVIDAHDIAIVSLGTAPSASVASSGYSLFTGNPFGIGQFVGSGATGTGNTGGIIDGDFNLSDRRRALNNVDFTWSDPRFGGLFTGGFFGDADPTTLVADFDNGRLRNDASCRVTADPEFFFIIPRCGLGLGNLEGSLGPGDSGGPLFMDGKIAGVASYGLTFGTDYGDIDDDLNSTFGEFSGWTSTQYNDDWLQPFAVVVPEPSSVALVGFGLIAMFGASKKRRRS